MRNVSGATYLQSLLETRRGEADLLWIVSSEKMAERARDWLGKNGVLNGQFHVMAAGDGSADHELLLRIEEGQPRHVVIATVGGSQEKLGIYLRDYLLYRPCLHCVGAGLAFLTGAERPIPQWAERFGVGSLARLASQPGMLLPRIGIAFALIRLLFRYRSELPPLRPRWADV